MKSLNEWRYGKKEEESTPVEQKKSLKDMVSFKEYVAKPVTAQQQAAYQQQAARFDPRQQQQQQDPRQQDPANDVVDGENIEPTKEDKLAYQGEMQGQLGTFFNLMQRAMYQRQQIFRRPAMLAMFLQDMLKLSVQISQNPSLVNRILLKLRADVAGSDPTNLALTPDIERGMDRYGKAVDPNTGRIVPKQSVQNN